MRYDFMYLNGFVRTTELYCVSPALIFMGLATGLRLPLVTMEVYFPIQPKMF